MFKRSDFHIDLLDESIIDDIPPKVFLKFKQRFDNPDVYKIEYAIKGFISFLSFCKAFPKTNIPMPSDVVDEIWHEFILHTRDYASFCDKYLGRFLHHVPNQDIERKSISEQEVSEILHLWTLTCLSENLDPFSSDSKPHLFYADVEFGEKQSMPNYARMLRRKTGMKTSNDRRSFEGKNKINEYQKSQKKTKQSHSSDAMLSTLLILDMYLYTEAFAEPRHAESAESSLSSCGTGSFILLSCSTHSCGGGDGGSHSGSHGCGGSSCGSSCGGGGD